VSWLRTRITRLEARQRRQQSSARDHFTSVAQVPPDVPDDAWDTWVAQQPCMCGVVGCPERRIGLLIPTKYTAGEEWEARVRTVYATKPPAFPRAEVAVMRNTIEGQR
jgi:hypothetical protein